MKKRLLVTAAVLGFAALGSWAPEASALYRYCSYNYCSTVSSTTRCTCPGTTISVQCGGWGASCADLP